MEADLAALRDLRPLLATALQRLDDVLGPDDLRTGKTPAAIVRLLEREGREVTVREILGALQVAGRDATEDGVAQACGRLAGSGAILRVRRGVYARRAG